MSENTIKKWRKQMQDSLLNDFCQGEIIHGQSPNGVCQEMKAISDVVEIIAARIRERQNTVLEANEKAALDKIIRFWRIKFDLDLGRH